MAGPKNERAIMTMMDVKFLIPIGKEHLSMIIINCQSCMFEIISTPTSTAYIFLQPSFATAWLDNLDTIEGHSQNSVITSNLHR